MLAVVATLIALNARVPIFALLAKIQIHHQNSIQVVIASMGSIGLIILMARTAALRAIVTAINVGVLIFA